MKMSNRIGVSVWCMMMAVIVAAAQERWNLDYDPDTYSTFLGNLREQLGAGTPKVCNRPVTNSNNNNIYILVDLVSNGNTITLALRASNGYLVGFQDRLPNNRLRANFFSDEYTRLNANYRHIFPNAVILGDTLPCASDYTDLVRKAGVSRDQLSLGLSNLENVITLVYGKDFTGKTKPVDIGKNLAKFALISIQMVVEAARFRYIENKVKTDGMGGSFQAGPRITLLENNWSKISNKYHKSCTLEAGEFTIQEMDLGLLLYAGAGLNSNDDHATLASI